jgi:hypothetical protein
MKPNGGKSHFTPITQRLRDFTYEGSGGSFAAAPTAAGELEPPLADVDANAPAATAATTSPIHRMNPAKRFTR